MRTHAQKPKRTPDPKPDAAAKTVAPTPAEPGELSLALALHAARRAMAAICSGDRPRNSGWCLASCTSVWKG